MALMERKDLPDHPVLPEPKEMLGNQVLMGPQERTALMV